MAYPQQNTSSAAVMPRPPKPSQPYPQLQTSDGGAAAAQRAGGINNQMAGQAMPPPPGGAPSTMQVDPSAPQPYPGTPPQAPLGPNSPFTPLQPVPPATPSPSLPYAPGTGGGGANDANFKGDFNAWNPNEKNQYGGQQIAGADPSQADYDSVQGYADQAYAESQRYMKPQHDQQNRRMQQELVNKGIDPNSPNGQEQMKMMAMQQGDQQNAAQFQALQFGQGIQNQMSQQELANQGLAGQMQQALWQNQLGSSGQDLQKYLGDQGFALGKGQLGNQRYGQDLNYMLGMGGQDLQRYGMDQNYQLGQGQLDMGRQGQDFNQMMGLEGVDFRNRAYGDQRGDTQNQLIMQMLGMGGPQMGGGSLDAGGAFGQTIGSAGQDKGILGALFG